MAPTCTERCAGEGSLTAINITGTTDVTAFRDMWARSYNLNSDRFMKEEFTPVDPGEVLANITTLPLTRWNYTGDTGVQHLGPVAQDFRAAFGLGSNDKTIATVDAQGVALAAIQGLNSKVDQPDNELRDLVKQQQEQIEALRAEIAALKAARE